MIYDIIIIGGGPGGLTAAIYGVRAGLTVLLFEMGMPGGLMAQTHEVENYPGFPDGIGGADLGAAMEKQAVRLGAQIKYAQVKKVELQGEIKTIHTRKEQFQARSVVIATGAAAQKLGAENEDALAGAGVSYCATCDGGFFKDKTIAVIGGGDTALGDASYLAKIAKKIYVIHRRDEFRAAKLVVDIALKNENVEPVYDTIVEKFIGDGQLSALKLRNVKTGEESELALDGAFVTVGTVPKTELFTEELPLQNGYVVTDAQMKTAVDGVYAVGDVRYGAFRQIVTACADAALAVEILREDLAQKDSMM